MRGSAPGERRGGRQAGTPNRKTTVLRDRLEADGIDPAAELVRVARAAEAGGELGIAADCWAKLSAYVYAKPRPVVLDPDELVALEGRIAAARADAVVRTVGEFDGLAERLARAEGRFTVVVEAPLQEVASAIPASDPQRPVAPAQSPPAPLPAGAADWTRPAPAYAPILPAFADMDYENAPDTLLSCYLRED